MHTHRMRRVTPPRGKRTRPQVGHIGPSGALRRIIGRGAALGEKDGRWLAGLAVRYQVCTEEGSQALPSPPEIAGR